MANWIFQGVPSRYDTAGDFDRGEPPAAWSIGRHRSDLTAGDRAALWIGGRSRPGIYALGTVDGEPFRAVAGRGWNEADKGKEFWFCAINLNRIFTSDPIPRSGLKADPRSRTRASSPSPSRPTPSRPRRKNGRSSKSWPRAGRRGRCHG